MTIQEAIRSGSPFRRRGHDLYYVRGAVVGEMKLSADDVLAIDWETEEEGIKLTKSQIVEAFKAADSRKILYQHKHHRSDPPWEMIGGFDEKKFLELLGFKDQ